MSGRARLTWRGVMLGWALAGLLWWPAAAPASTAAADMPVSAWWQNGRPSALADEALALLADADSQGLDPADYHAAALARAWTAARQAGPPGEAQAQRLAQALAWSLQVYLQHLHDGRVDGAGQYRGQATPSRTGWTAADALAQALAAGRLATVVRAAWPSHPHYPVLQAALAQYRQLADHPAWAGLLPAQPRSAGLLPALPRSTGPLPAQPRSTSPPGPLPAPSNTHWPGLPVLVQRLQALGDLAADARPADLLDEPLLAALRRFQQRHGLATDGLLGPATLAALNTRPSARAQQIGLTMERLRWRPQPAGARWIEVNLPEFQLRLMEAGDATPQACGQIAVIVGQARRHATPLMLADMQMIEFSPYWNVPPSIAREELVPKLRRDPSHAAAQGYEAVLPGGQVVRGIDGAVLYAVLAGSARLRQRPGEHNALGSIKFVFPNRDNIYLHHTPAVGSFGQVRRDFSHGCIRVQQPVALAMFVLRDQPEWTESRIRNAMASGQSASLRLARPLPVLISHETVVPVNGQLHFLNDLYALDAALASALRQRPRSPLPLL